jgi:heptosyltransferase II
VLRPCPLKDDLLFWLPRRRSGRVPASNVMVGMLGPARQLRARGYDRCYILRRAFSAALLAWLAGIPHRVGFGTEGRGLFLTRATPYPTDKHEVECFLEVLRADGIPTEDTANAGWSDPATDRLVAAQLSPAGRRRVFLCAKSSNPLKDWRPERFAAVAAWLISERDAEIHVCDHPSNAALYATMRDALPPGARPHWHDWSSRLDLAGTLSLLRQMQLHVGVDTGLTHLSASFRVPVVVLMEPWMITRWHPWDTRHEIVTAQARPPAPIFDAVSPADVQTAIDRVLAPAP